MKNNENGAVVVLALLLLMAAIIPEVAWSGYVLSIMWGWFVAPTFSIPYLTIPVAIGISITFRFMCPTTDCKKDDEDDSTMVIVFKSLLRGFLIPALLLLFGYIVKQWM